MKSVKRIRFTDESGNKRVTSVEGDEELQVAIETMTALGETVDSVEEVELTPETLLNDIMEFIETDPDVQALLEEKRKELGDDFEQWLHALIGTMYADVMTANKWRL